MAISSTFEEEIIIFDNWEATKKKKSTLHYKLMLMLSKKYYVLKKNVRLKKLFVINKMFQYAKIKLLPGVNLFWYYT